MTIDLHAHVTVDVPDQLARAASAGVELTVLQATRIHPEARTTLPRLRTEVARLQQAIGGHAASLRTYRQSLAEVRDAIRTGNGAAVGFVPVPLDLQPAAMTAWLAEHLDQPDLVGIGELTPPPGRIDLIEPALQVASDHGGVPVLVHGFAPHTLADLRAYAELATRYRDVPVVVGAFGGLHCLDLVELALDVSNLYLDLSSALQVFVVRLAADLMPQRCLFGSNTPYGDVAAARATVEAAVRDPGVRRAVLADNAARLLGRA